LDLALADLTRGALHFSYIAGSTSKRDFFAIEFFQAATSTGEGRRVFSSWRSSAATSSKATLRALVFLKTSQALP
jgi:hypothetical protein